jgi:hypothetical protein
MVTGSRAKFFWAGVRCLKFQRERRPSLLARKKNLSSSTSLRFPKREIPSLISLRFYN